jgi:phospholipid/cholesterol/gamma-HCH transport system substrate-binding protein
MEYFRTDVKVGGFILVALVLLVFAAITVGDLGNWFATKNHYTVLFQDASLVPEGARVSYAGYAVGQVTAIAMRTDAERAQQYPNYHVALTLTIRSTVPVREDSRIEMKTNGMIGDRYVDILPGSGHPLPSGSTLLGAMGGLDGMFASLADMQGEIQDTITALHMLLSDTSRPDSIPVTLASVNRLLEELRPRLTRLTETGNDLLQDVQKEVVSTSGQARRVLKGIDATIAENRPGLRRLVGELNTTMAEARQTMGATRQLLETSKDDVVTLLQSVRSLVEGLQENRRILATRVDKLLEDVDEMVVQNDRNIYLTIENLRDMTANLEATSELVRTNPAILLWGRRGHDGSGVVPASGRGDQGLQDRGRIGRYDRAR